MKRFIIITMFAAVILPAFAEENASLDNNGNPVPAVESVRYFARPSDSRFQYSLPDAKKFKPFKKAETASLDDDAIELDEQDIRPAKKIIKRMSADSDSSSSYEVDNSALPMNYDNFPKFYNPNDLSNQQFLPMIGY